MISVDPLLDQAVMVEHAVRCTTRCHSLAGAHLSCDLGHVQRLTEAWEDNSASLLVASSLLHCTFSPHPSPASRNIPQAPSSDRCPSLLS